MPEYSSSREFLNTDRACQELRRGRTVMLRLENGSACLLRAAELSCAEDRNTLQGLAGSGALLVLTRTRVESLGHKLGGDFRAVSLSAQNLDDDGLAALGVEQPVPGLLADQVSLVGEREGSIADYAARLLRVARLLPAALVANMPTRDTAILERCRTENGIMGVMARDIDRYVEAAAQSLGVVARAKLPLRLAGEAEIVMFRGKMGGQEHFAVLVGEVDRKSAPLVRLHSQCVTGDVLGSLKCDCGEQLNAALSMMAKAGGGILIYLAQEGRDIGLLNKMRAYAFQDSGLDTVDANHALGFEQDERVFLPAVRMLGELGVPRLRLITNNPDKISQIEKSGIEVVERVALEICSNDHNRDYLRAKRDKAGHLIESE